MRFFSRLIIFGLSLGVLGAILGVGVLAWALFNYSGDLPEYQQLENYEPPIVTRVYADDGQVLAEFATEKRVFVPINAIPDRVIQAFLSAEDQHFYYHPGVDFIGVMRAILTNIKNLGSNRRLVGASTITQQVAKNFLLTNEVSYERKIKEAILAFRLEKAFSKEKILELYLNEIYLGNGTYGVAAAALDYFDKALGELTIEEVAYLAALPKAPSNYHPVKRYDAAVERRDWVIGRLLDDGYISKSEADLAKAKRLVTNRRDRKFVRAPYFSEEVRRKLVDLYGDSNLYKSGLLVHATVDASMQKVAERALRDGLVAYDRRHGVHSGIITHFDTMDGWLEQLRNVATPAGANEWKLAVVLKSKSKTATIGFITGNKGIVTYNKVKWARKRLRNNKLGAVPKHVHQVLKVGDVILTEDADELTKKKEKIYHYRQIPKIQGGFIALDPHTGRVLAMVGGFSQERSEFNRATQAKRQPGSAFKPFVYLTALESGFTPATLVLDAPFVMDQGPGLPKWRPSNYSGEFYGLTPFRVGIEKSRNLMTVRLANYIGMEKIAETSERFGVHKNLPQFLSMSLGAGETTLLKMAAAYSVFVNGGKQVIPTFIDRIQDRHGGTIFKHDTRDCPACGSKIAWDGQETPKVIDDRKQLTDPRYAYQIASIMQGVVQRGTGVRLKSLNFPLAGKTGTSNEEKDTWFIGFTPDLVVGAYVGFDNPAPLGRRETGSSVAAPVVKTFLEDVLKDLSPIPFRVPKGIKHIRINANDGTRAEFGDERVILEAFLTGTEPTDQPVVFDGDDVRQVADTDSSIGEGATVGTGGLY